MYDNIKKENKPLLEAEDYISLDEVEALLFNN